MTKREEIFVSNKLDNMRSFRYKDDFSVNLNNFSILELNKILSLGNNNGMLMLSISYYIDIFFSKYTIKQKSVFFLQTDKYINKLEFDKEGKNGKIYSSILFNKLPVIIKMFKSFNTSSIISREFLIGYLRYTLTLIRF